MAFRSSATVAESLFFTLEHRDVAGQLSFFRFCYLGGFSGSGDPVSAIPGEPLSPNTSGRRRCCTAHVRVVHDVGLHLVPVVLVVADALAVSADGQQPLQRLHPLHGLFDFAHAATASSAWSCTICTPTLTRTINSSRSNGLVT